MRFSPGCNCCGGGPVETDCCPDGMPETLFVTLSGLAGDAGQGCLDDISYQLDWNGSNWQYSQIVSSGTPLCTAPSGKYLCQILLTLSCAGGGGSFGLSVVQNFNTASDCSGSTFAWMNTTDTDASFTCDPFSATFSFSGTTFDGDAFAFTATVTE